MIVLKSTYNKLFELFVKEKHGALDLYKENEKLRLQIRGSQDLVSDLYHKLLDSEDYDDNLLGHRLREWIDASN